jgi:hypothetical protein
MPSTQASYPLTPARQCHSPFVCASSRSASVQVQAVAPSVREESAKPSGHRTAVAGLGDSDLPEEQRPDLAASLGREYRRRPANLPPGPPAVTPASTESSAAGCSPAEQLNYSRLPTQRAHSRKHAAVVGNGSPGGASRQRARPGNGWLQFSSSRARRARGAASLQQRRECVLHQHVVAHPLQLPV